MKRIRDTKIPPYPPRMKGVIDFVVNLLDYVPRVEKRERRHKRIRRKIFGTPEWPRLCVYRSLNAFYAQIIDDTRAHTLWTFHLFCRSAVQIQDLWKRRKQEYGPRIIYYLGIEGV